ncbi:MAG: AcrR family transcriptional regulator [Planctomycetota bacterium]|jgi:AcrR family transcriptional regulator
MARSKGTALKQRILEEARRVLEAEGYQALSTRRLAGALGVTATSLYLYFDNKEALLQALIAEGFEDLGQRLEAATQGAEPVLRPRALAEAYVSFGLEQPAWYELMFLLPGQRLGGTYPPDKYRAGRGLLHGLSQLLAGASHQELSEVDALAHATLLWSSLHGLVSLLIAGRVDAALDRTDLIARALERAVPLPTTLGTTRVPGSMDTSS